jgi:hypothetical protein
MHKVAKIGSVFLGQAKRIFRGLRTKLAFLIPRADLEETGRSRTGPFKRTVNELYGSRITDAIAETGLVRVANHAVKAFNIVMIAAL